MDANYAIVVSKFNSEITSKLSEGAVNRLKESNVPDQNITVVHVPGAIEIPLVAQRLAQQNKYSAIIALGCVIQGDTDHYIYVCDQISQGCQRVMLDNNIPVIFGVLMTQDESQAEERIGGIHGHKGVDAANAALEIVETLSKL